MDAITCCCPTCGQPLHSQLQWNEGARTFIANGVSVRFTKGQSEVFGAVWRTQKRIMSLERLAQIAWAERINGGPENLSTISVQLAHIRRRMAPTGYTISGKRGGNRDGWRIVPLEIA